MAKACPICRIVGCDRPDHNQDHIEAARKRRVSARQRATYRPYCSAERREHERMIAAHVARFGWWCPGAPELGHDPHPVSPGGLDVDHIQRVIDGGSRVGGPKRVLCRAINRGRR